MTTNTNAALGGTFLLGGDLPVHRLGFGAMRLPTGTFQGAVRDPETGVAVLRRAVELGVDHIDTAWFYRRGGVAANDLIRRALAPYADDLVIATKVGPLLDDDGVPSSQAGPDELRGLVEDNLRTLGVERLDLVYLRVGGLNPPGGESISDRFAVLAELREEGLIRHLGISNVDIALLDEALAIAPVAAVQNSFHVQDRGDTELLARCEKDGIAFVPFFPLGGGLRPIDQTRLTAVMRRHGATAAQIALAWLLATSPAALAIPGTGSLDHLEENMGAGRIRLTPEDLAALEQD
ncbi:oxidoreductase [Microbispora bryophytorum]|uniref:Oxidoreductase n=1 Tax=Microbispora bryophytorum TaxID=1460882 RepID=A0A8H9GUA8_9ACTN|nr:oxidoreductase [Microbispora bryophytorum]MBD3138790.1 oxidoreductase [Microbispora bryophytorum]TQS10062.1 oxidoreductase [Microbispora bryophytorum]GGO00219.1 oxidoreductase [Microbispora bryophytorum]